MEERIAQGKYGKEDQSLHIDGVTWFFSQDNAVSKAPMDEG